MRRRILLTLVAAFELTVAAAADADPFPATFRRVHIERVAEHRPLRRTWNVEAIRLPRE